MDRNSGNTPSEIRLNKAKSELLVSFDPGDDYTFSAEFLRVHSPSAEVQGHSPDERKTVSGKEMVRIDSLEPVGNYAIQINFSDGHDTGLFSWSYLQELGQSQDKLWERYLGELAEQNLSRH
jgi:DUF971 family protein